MPLSPGSSHTHLSPKGKSLSTSPNFNPFAPLSPYQAHKRLGDDDFEGLDDASPRRVYSRNEMLRIASECRRTGWTIPKSLRPLDQWYSSSSKTPVDDPAIASIGQSPGRKAPGFGEGFGYGGGIGGRLLGKGSRQPGHSQGENRSRRSEHDANGLPTATKDQFGGQMGRFSMKTSSDRTKPAGSDDNRRTRDDWRKAPGHLPQRLERSERPPDRRQWNDRHEDDFAQPAWLEDQTGIDPAIIQDPLESQPFRFGSGEDPIAAHKRMMKEAAEGRIQDGRRHLTMASGAPDADVVDPTKMGKTTKQFNAADYLLPSKNPSTTGAPLPTAGSSLAKDLGAASRFQRFFGAHQVEAHAHSSTSSHPSYSQSVQDSQDERPSATRASTSDTKPVASDGYARSMTSPPPGLGPPPPHDHASRLMGLLTSKNVPPNHPYPAPPGNPPLRSPSPPPGVSFDRSQCVSPPPPPGVPFPHHPTGAGTYELRDTQERDMMRAQGQLPHSAYLPHFQHQHTGRFTPHHLVQQPGPHMGTFAPLHAAQRPPLPPPTALRQDYQYGPLSTGYGNAQPMPVPPALGQLPSRQQNMLATLYGNLPQGNR